MRYLTKLKEQHQGQIQHPITTLDGLWASGVCAISSHLALNRKRKAAMPFVEIYKEHEINVSAWEFPDKKHWEPHVLVTWKDGSQTMDRLPNFIQSFPTREEAEKYGVTFARNWIDGGKPSLA